MHDGLNISVFFAYVLSMSLLSLQCCLCSAVILVIVYDFQTEACANMETCL